MCFLLLSKTGIFGFVTEQTTICNGNPALKSVSCLLGYENYCFATKRDDCYHVSRYMKPADFFKVYMTFFFFFYRMLIFKFESVFFSLCFSCPKT